MQKYCSITITDILWYTTKKIIFYAIFQTKMNCSACIQNPIQFLGKFTHRLIPQKNLPTVYDDNLIGNTLQHMINIFPVKIMRHC